MVYTCQLHKFDTTVCQLMFGVVINFVNIVSYVIGHCHGIIIKYSLTLALSY